MNKLDFQKVGPTPDPLKTVFNALKENESMAETIVVQAAKIKDLEEAYQVSLGLNKSYLEQCAEQAAVIEKLRSALTFTYLNPCCSATTIFNVAEEALAIPTDSKQILAEWLDKILGEPLHTLVFNFKNSEAVKLKLDVPLFKKPVIV